MKRLRTLIVDDEPLAREGLALMLHGDPEVELVGQCEDGVAALAAISAQKPDLVFLDVQMPEAGGLEVLEALEPEDRPVVVFVTAYHEHAVRAFELSAVDYVLKPFRDERFRAALIRAKQQAWRADVEAIRRQTEALLEQLRQLKGAAGTVSSSPPARLVLRTGEGHLFLEPAEIAWIEAQGPGVRLFARGQTHAVREAMQSIEQRLDPAVFVRIHRSFIVNKGAVARITPAGYGDHVVVTTDGAQLRLSRSYRDRLKALIKVADV